MATRHSADRRHNDSTRTPESWTPRAERHRSSRVGRPAEMRPQPSRCLQERRQKGDDGTFGPASLRSSTRRKRPRSRLRSRVRSFRLIPRTSRPPRVVQAIQLGIAPLNRESRSHAGFRPPEWRDPDSNRGHHDFQSCASSGPGRRNPWKSCGFGRDTALTRCSQFADICRRLWEWRAPQAQTATRAVRARTGGRA